MEANESTPPEGGQMPPAVNQPTGSAMSFFDKVRMVLTKPNEFFAAILKQEQGIQSAFIYYAIISLVSALLSGWQAQNIAANYGAFSPLGNQTSFIGSAITTYIFVLVMIFVVAAILHQFVKLFKGQGGFDRTFQAAVYGGTAGVLSNVPLIGWLFVIYSIYLTLVGLKQLHTMPMTQAVWAYIVTLLVIFAVIFVVMLLFIGSVATLFGFFL